MKPAISTSGSFEDWFINQYQKQKSDGISTFLETSISHKDWFETQYRIQKELPNEGQSSAQATPQSEEQKRRMWAPEEMMAALAESRDPSNIFSTWSIAHHHKVPYNTLRDYLKLGRTSVPPMGASPVLTSSGRANFVDWLKDRCFLAAPVSRPLANEKLKLIVEDLRKQRGDKQRMFGTVTGEPGKNWWARMFRLHSDLRRRVPSRHSAATLRAALKPETYTRFFDGVRPELSKIPQHRRFTADEFALSANKNNSKVIYVEGTGKCEALESDGYTAHVSLINNVCCDGTPLETVILYGQRKENLKLERLNDKVLSLGYTPSGWQNERSFLLYLKWFKDRTKPTREDPVALIVDQHSTRFSLNVREFCRANYIILVLLPPNMTSKLAVLDVALHRGLRAKLRTLIGTNLSKFIEFRRDQVAEIVRMAYLETFKSSSIINGWKATCLDTLDPTPLVQQLQKREEEMKKGQQRRAEERKRLQELLREEKNPEVKNELEAAAAQAEVMDRHLDRPALPAARRARKKRTMPDGGILTSDAEEKRQQEFDADKSADKPARRTRKRKAASKKKSSRSRKRHKSDAADGKEEKADHAESKRQSGRAKRSSGRGQESDSEDDDKSAQSSSSSHSHNAAVPMSDGEEESLTEQSETESAGSDVSLASDDELSAEDLPDEGMRDDEGDVVLGECMSCEEPVFASEKAQQCCRCTGLLHHSCVSTGHASTRTRQRSFICPPCRSMSN